MIGLTLDGLSLFDVSVPSVPTEVDSIIIGKRGTQSEALFDHHALAWLPVTDQSPARLALPVRLHDRPGDNDWFDPARPNSYYDWTHTGLYLFEIDDTGVAPAGRMVVEEWPETEYSQGYDAGDRTVLLDGSVHYIHDAKVWSADWETPENLFGPQQRLSVVPPSSAVKGLYITGKYCYEKNGPPVPAVPCFSRMPAA